MLTAREIRQSAVIAFFLFLVLSSPRAIAVPVFVIATIVSLWPGLKGYRKTRIAAWILFAAVSLSPLDLYVPKRYTLHGTAGEGLRLVRLQHGLPIHTRLIEKYGEYYSGGCITPTWPATWILTWE